MVVVCNPNTKPPGSVSSGFKMPQYRKGRGAREMIDIGLRPPRACSQACMHASTRVSTHANMHTHINTFVPHSHMCKKENKLLEDVFHRGAQADA